MQQKDDVKCSEWIDNLYSYLEDPNSNSVQSLILATDQWIEYFAKQLCPNVSVAIMSKLSQVSSQLLDRCKEPSVWNRSTDLILFRKILAVWRNSCRHDDFRRCLVDSGFIGELVSHLETLLEGEGSFLVSTLLQLFVNVTNDKNRPFCLWSNVTTTPNTLFHLLLSTAKKEYDRNSGNSKLLLAFEMVWNNQFFYLLKSESQMLNQGHFWSTLLSWIAQHVYTRSEHYCDILYCLFIMMEKMAENDVLCNWLFYITYASNGEEFKVTLKNSDIFPFVAILRDALLVGEKSIPLFSHDICSLCLSFQRLNREAITVDESHVAWLELIATLLADHFSLSLPIDEEVKEYLVSVVDSCCYVLRLIQEDTVWMVFGDKVGLKTTLTRLLCNICSSCNDMISYIVNSQQYLLTLLKQWQLDIEAPLSFEWTVFLFRLVCEHHEAPPVIKQTLQACHHHFSNASQQ